MAIPSITGSIAFQRDQTLKSRGTYWDTTMTVPQQGIEYALFDVLDTSMPLTASTIESHLRDRARTRSVLGYSGSAYRTGVKANIYEYWGAGSPTGVTRAGRVALRFSGTVTGVGAAPVAVTFVFGGNGQVCMTRNGTQVLNGRVGEPAVYQSFGSEQLLEASGGYQIVETTVRDGDSLVIYYLQQGEAWGGIFAKIIPSVGISGDWNAFRKALRTAYVVGSSFLTAGAVEGVEIPHILSASVARSKRAIPSLELQVGCTTSDMDTGFVVDTSTGEVRLVDNASELVLKPGRRIGFEGGFHGVGVGDSPSIATPPPTFVGAGNKVVAGGDITEGVYEWPAGHQANDLALIVHEMVDNLANPDVPEGWQMVPGSPIGMNNSADTHGTRLTAYWRRATSDAEPSVVVQQFDHQVGQMFVFRGVRTTGSPWASEPQWAQVPTTSQAVSWPAGTTTVDSALVIPMIAVTRNATHVDYFSHPVDAPDFTSIQKLDENVNTIGQGGGYAVFAGVKDVAGQYRPITTFLEHALPTAVLGILSLAPEPIGGEVVTGEEMYPRFMGLISRIEPTEDGDVATIHCVGFEAKLETTLDEDFPDYLSYLAHGYIDRKWRGYPVYGARCYDAWPLESIMVDLLHRAGVDSYNMGLSPVDLNPDWGRRAFITSRTQRKVYGSKLLTVRTPANPEEPVYVQRATNYGNIGVLRSDRLPEDDEYVHAASVSDRLWDKVTEIADQYGYDFFATPEGQFALRARNNPTSFTPFVTIIRS